MYKPPKNPQIEELTKSHRESQYSLGDIKLPEGMVKSCIWCLEPLGGRARRWCGDEECVKAALAWGRPQCEHGLYYLLLKQELKCNDCGFSYKKYFDEAMPTIEGQIPGSNEIHFGMRTFRGMVPYEVRPEVDHIVAISLGGTALGLENHQVLCMKCHKEKTASDSKERAKSGILKGRAFSDEHKRSMSRARKGVDTDARRHSREVNLYPLLKIPIVATNLKTGERLEFDSMKDAAIGLNLNESNISRTLRREQNRKQHKGWTFEYAWSIIDTKKG